MLDAGVGKLNSLKVNFLSGYKLALAVTGVAAWVLPRASHAVPERLSTGTGTGTWVRRAAVPCKPSNSSSSSPFPPAGRRRQRAGSTHQHACPWRMLAHTARRCGNLSQALTWGA